MTSSTRPTAARPVPGVRPAPAEPLPERGAVATELSIPDLRLVAWGGIAAVSLLVRGLLLDRAALTPGEATYALAAWQASRGVLDGSLVDLGAPLLSYLTTLGFFLLGAGDGTARLVPLVAGTLLPLTPALLTATIGLRVSLLAALLIALSPIAVQLARLTDPASMTTLVATTVVFSTIRLLTDRPSWSPWVVAISAGLAMASASSVLVAGGAAVIAALSTWSVSRAELRRWSATLRSETAQGAAAAGALAAVVAATAGFMDLRGIGFVTGDLWGGIAAVLTPAPFPTRNLAALLAYAGPVLLLAIVGFVQGVRAGDRVLLFLAEWSILLLAVAAVFGQSVLALALFPVAPTALLAGRALGSIPLEAVAARVSGTGWGSLGLSLLLVGAVVLVVAHTIGGSRPATPFAFIAIALMVALVALLWWQGIPSGERIAVLMLCIAITVLLLSLSTIARTSFGGSPPGTELLLRQETAPELRGAFEELYVLSMADASRALIVGPSTPIEVRWYGRDLPQATGERAAPANAFAVREAPPADPGVVGRATDRVPWTTISQLDRTDLHLLGVLRWLVSRSGLVEGRSLDIILAR